MPPVSALQPYPWGTKNNAPNTLKYNFTDKVYHHKLPTNKPERLDEKNPDKQTNGRTATGKSTAKRCLSEKSQTTQQSPKKHT